MELGLSLGDSSRPFGFLPKNRETVGKGLCMALGINLSSGREREKPEPERENPSHGRSADEDDDDEDDDDGDDHNPLQLDLLPLAPLTRRTTSHGSSEGGSSAARGFDVNRLPPQATAAEDAEEGAAAVSSSPNSVASSFQMDFCIFRGGDAGNKRDLEAAGIEGGEAAERASSRASDDDDNSLARKKLRLSKEQSAYLEESFKEHNTLNPKQKLALAKQLNLRPRQVEVWFQNRRARTKLKQTEVDCEYLKRCCETLSEENRKLHKELQELRALKNTSNPFYMQLPATTLTMCPSCERVASTTTAATATASTATNSIDPSSTAATTTTPFPLSRPRLFPFPHTQPHQSAAS